MNSIFGGKLPIKVIPFEDELLSSWLCRIAQANSIKLSTFNATVFPATQLWNRDIDKCASMELQKQLEIKTGVKEKQIRQTFLQEYEGKIYENHIPNGNNVWIMPVGVFHSIRKRHGLQICPFCLKEDKQSYYRKNWRLSLSTVCLKHFIILLDECPNCQNQIMFHRNELGIRQKYKIQSITICSFCGLDWSSNECLAKSEKVSETEIKFQRKLFETLELNWFEFSTNNYIHSIPFFKGLAQIVKLLSVSSLGEKLKKVLSKESKLEFYTNKNKVHTFDHLRVKDRHITLQLAAWVVENWSRKFVELCETNKIWSFTLLHSMVDIPFWYDSLITEKLTRRNRVYTKQEIISILNYFEKKEVLIKPIDIKNLMGTNDIFDFFPYSFTISILKQMLWNNKVVWEKVRKKRVKYVLLSNDWANSVKMEKEIGKTQSLLENLICEYEAKERLDWVNAYLKIKNARKTGEVFGISEHTVRKWVKIYRKFGVEGLKTTFKTTLSEIEETWILQLYDEGLNSREIQNELKKRYGFIIDNTTLLRRMKKMILPLPNPKKIVKSHQLGNKNIIKRRNTHL